MNPTKWTATALLVQVLALGAAAPALAQQTEATPPAEAGSEPAAAPGVAAPAAVAPAADAEPWEPRTLDFPIQLSGYSWVDTGYLDRTNTQAGQYDQGANYMQGRIVVAGRYERAFGAYHVAAVVELAGLVNEYSKSQYEPHTLDAFLAVGVPRRWELVVGRFLGWEVYYRGQGIELYTAEEAGALGGPPLYWLDAARGHKNEAGQAAVRVFPLEGLGLEVASVYGQEASQNQLGVRPVADLNLSRWIPGLKLIGGYEYLKLSPQTDADNVESTTKGYAGRIQYSLAPAGGAWLRAPTAVTYSEHAGQGWASPLATVGVDLAQVSTDATQIDGLVDSEKTFDKTSVGAFADLSFWKSSVGLAYHRTSVENAQGEENVHHQASVSYLHRLPFEGLSVKAVYGFARAELEDVDSGATWENDLQSFRVRLRYDFR
jgi:hypothetical protein